MKDRIIHWLLNWPYPLYKALSMKLFTCKTVTFNERLRYFVLTGKRWGHG